MGEIYVIGMGPGSLEQMTIQAKQVMDLCDVIVGYTVYIDLVKPFYNEGEKEFLTTPMRKEIERCRLCYERALMGQKVALICSGDAGVYGMSAPMLELALEYPEVSVERIAGTTAAITGAAVLGAPLTHDFAVISLSDLLTPMETIEKRIKAAAMADFVICIYNPSSHKRKDYLKKACDWILETGEVSKERICGYVENIGREGETYHICTLEALRDTKVNMFTTVFIGNSQTKRIGDKMVTPRGYEI